MVGFCKFTLGMSRVYQSLQIMPTKEGDLVNTPLLKALLQGCRCASAGRCRLQDPLAVRACLLVSHLQARFSYIRVRNVIHCITVNFARSAIGYVLLLVAAAFRILLQPAPAFLSATYKHPHLHQGCEC